jgi:transcriptional regulator with XRE-family HTH domain
MIRSEAEYRKARRDLDIALRLLVEEQAYWLDQGMSEDESSSMLEPVRLRIAELRDRIMLFERIRTGDLSSFTGHEDMGKALIAARLARGLTQREFAELAGSHESQVSRDEKNEYHGVGEDRLRALMNAVGLNFEGQYFLVEIVVRPRLVSVDQPTVYRQAAGFEIDPDKVARDLKNAVA